MIGKIDQGDNGIIDFKSKFYASKASWISRISNEESVTDRSLNSIMNKRNLTVYDVIKTSECKLFDSEFFKMLNIPFFYGNVFPVFNKCKKHWDVNTLKWDEFMFQFI